MNYSDILTFNSILAGAWLGENVIPRIDSVQYRGLTIHVTIINVPALRRGKGMPPTESIPCTAGCSRFLLLSSTWIYGSPHRISLQMCWGWIGSRMKSKENRLIVWQVSHPFMLEFSCLKDGHFRRAIPPFASCQFIGAPGCKPRRLDRWNISILFKNMFPMSHS